jgi:Tfp pilus assembly protein PilN
MTWRMVASPFEFAPDAARYHPLSWASLLGGVSAALIGVYMIWEANGRLDGTLIQQTRLLQQQKTHSEQARQAARDPLTLERFKAHRQLEAMLQTPWSLLLDALEAAADAVEGRVTLLSISPSSSPISPVNRKIELTMAASSYGAMLAYMDAMSEVGGFSDVRISSHQMDDRIGPAAIRYRVTAGWNHLKEGVFLARAPSIAPGTGVEGGPTSANSPIEPLATRVPGRSPPSGSKEGLSR